MNRQNDFMSDPIPPLPPPAPEYLKMKKKKKKKKRFNYKLLAALIVVLIGTIIFSYAQWGADLIAFSISEETELSLGKGVISQIQGKGYHFVMDNEIVKKLNEMALDIYMAGKANNKTNYPVHAPNLLILQEKIPNAFAVPGGNILITTGLLCLSKKGEEIAYVLAHEMGHVFYRHPLRQFIRGLGLNIIAFLLTGRGSSELVFLMLNNSYSREFETQADRFSLRIGQVMGWDPRNFISILTRISRVIGDMDIGGEFEVLRDHPVLEKRVNIAKKYIKLKGGTLDTYSFLMQEIHKKLCKN